MLSELNVLSLFPLLSEMEILHAVNNFCQQSNFSDFIPIESEVN